MKKFLLSTATIIAISTSSSYAIENDFFAKINIGHSNMTKTNGAKSDNNFFLAIGAGYYVMDNLRIDATIDHFVNPTFSSGKKRIKGEINTIRLNGFIDIFDISLAKIFIGAGVGGSQVKAKISGDDLAANNGTAKQQYNFSYAIYTGTSMEFAPNMTAELSYSYRHMGKTKELNGFDVGFKGHHIGAGIRFDL